MWENEQAHSSRGWGEIQFSLHGLLVHPGRAGLHTSTISSVSLMLSLLNDYSAPKIRKEPRVLMKYTIHLEHFHRADDTESLLPVSACPLYLEHFGWMGKKSG